MWDEEAQEWVFSVVNVVAVLTETADPKQYNKKMRSRDPELNSRWGTICTPTRMIKCEGTLMDGTKVYANREFALSSLF